MLTSARTQGKGMLATFVIAGGLIATMPLPSHAADPTGQTIVPAPKPVPNDPHYMRHKADLRLKLDVKRGLAMSPFVDADHIGVTVRDGVVTLRGAVEDTVSPATRLKTPVKPVPKRSLTS